MAGAALMLAFSATAMTAAVAVQPGQPRLAIAGVAQAPCQPERALPVPARLSGQFEPDSSILVTAGATYAGPGRPAVMTLSQPACAAAAERADRDWLRAGLVPGVTTAQRSLATRALLDLRLAVQPNGAVVAGWRRGWEYVWPRDSCWVAVALAETGRPAMAYRILRFLQRMQGRNGMWAARYLPDGSGPVRDGRPAELDAVGWVPWAVWSWAATQQLTPVPNGGLQPGTTWPGTPGVAWTAETAFFALFDAATGQHGRATALLGWLAAHTTKLGSLPEQVNSAGQPAGAAPLAWTDAVTLLALLAQAGHVPTIPLPHPGR